VDFAMASAVRTLFSLSVCLWTGPGVLGAVADVPLIPGSSQQDAPIVIADARTNAPVAGNADGAEQDVDTSSDPYPHITEIEKAILGTTYVKQQLPARLSRMETKAFGAPSTKADLADRTDALESYVEKTLHVKFPEGGLDDTTADAPDPSQGGPSGMQRASATTSDGSAATSDASQTDTSQSDYPRVTALEQAILQKTFPGQPLADRLSRMETTAFGKPSDKSGMADRTDALERYAEKTLHKKLHEQPDTADAGGGSTQNGSGSQKILSFLEKSLLGMAGIGPGGIGSGGIGAPGGMGGPYGGGGFGPFGGIRARPRSQVQQAPRDQTPAPPPEDPAVNEPNPPPSSAKLLTQVGWCEVHVFGHTFSAMHLPGRLGQLNRELKFEPGTSDIDLMDHISSLIKAVQTRDVTAPKVVAKPQAQAQ
jgi:hypothetical protein